MQSVHFLDERHILLFLVQFFILLGSAKLLGALFIRIKQPTVTADILVGILLGPTILGRFAPGLQNALFPPDVIQQNMIETIAWTGILFLLLATGLEVNFSSIWKQKAQAIRISAADIVLPILITGTLIYFLPSRYMVDENNRLLFTFFLGTIMTISAMPIAIRAMRDMNLMKTDMGFLVISCLSINDIIGWIIFTIILGLFAQNRFDPLYAVSIAGFTVGFTALALTIGKRVLDAAITGVKGKGEENSGYALTVVALVGLLFGAITQKIGIHALFGFFIAGMIAGEARDLSERTRSTITQIVHAVFVPIFFANIGLKFDILASFDLFLVLFITIIGTGARFVAAYIGSIFARTAKANRSTIAVLHTPGGEMHIVISTLAVELGLITHTVYVAIIAGAIISSITLGPWLSFVLKRRQTRKVTLRIPGRAIITELDSENRPAAIEKLCSAAATLKGLEYEQLYTAVMTREQQMSTALENGVAVPHARLIQLSQPTVVFGRQVSGIEWNSIDGKPAQLIFLILTPLDDSDVQIQLYASLAKALSAPELRDELLKQQDSLCLRKTVENIFTDIKVKSANTK